MKEALAMTDQTTTTVGSRPGLPGDLAARAPARDAPAASPRRADDEPSAAQPTLMTGAQALVAALERLGVDVVFGIPGGAILPAYDPLFDSRSVRHILVRHEQGAGHAAAGYAQVTGRPGVCIVTSGPGATNLVTPLADAVQPDRHRQFPGGGHRRDHAARHQAQLPRHRGRRHRQDGG
jgi:acetolactate synthase-1/2/3 large subunit